MMQPRQCPGRALSEQPPEISNQTTAAGELEPLSIDRYNVEPPAAPLADDAGAWRTALDNCRAQLEHQVLPTPRGGIDAAGPGAARPPL
jgi:hypothetical protein